MTSSLLVKPVKEICFGAYGGAELFFADVDSDGRLEVLAYQGPAVFGASMYRKSRHVAAAFPRSTCLSAFRRDGARLWTWGEPNPADRPYICHAHESCVATGDIDGDGRVEVALADGDELLILDGPTGELRKQVRFAEDNFYIVQLLGQPTSADEAAMVVKNGEEGYGYWKYGEPIIGLNEELKITWGPMAVPGAGHHIPVLDLDGDGKMEYLVGYCAVKASGKIIWSLDTVNPKKLDPKNEHVDYVDFLPLEDGQLAIAFAASRRGYLAFDGGRTAFVHPDRHVQGCVIGHFRTDSPYQVAIYNDDGPIVLCDPRGRILWRRPAPLRWPLGEPTACKGHPFHRNRPVVKFSRQDKDWILFTDGGWPWGMDGSGEISLGFEPPVNSRQPEASVPLPHGARGDDMGYGFATQMVDWDGDGVKEALIYDRRFLWIFAPEKT